MSEPTIDDLLAENAALTKALTGLTRGGSEYFVRKGDRYVADIPACLDYVRKLRASQHREIVRLHFLLARLPQPENTDD